MNFLEELVKNKIIREEQIPDISKTANEKYKGSIDQALLDFNIDEGKALSVKGNLYNIPTKEIDPNSVLPSTLKLIPAETVKMYHFVPIGVNDEVLEVGTIDPDNVSAIDVLTFITTKIGKPFKLFLIRASAYNEILNRYDGLSDEVGQALSELDSEIAATKGVNIAEGENDKNKNSREERIIEEAPIIKIVAITLRHALEENASDIHIENMGDKIKVRFRVDGILHTSLTLPLSVYNGVVARIKILSKLRLDEKRKPQDGGFSAKIDGRKVDFRVSTMPAYFGEKVVMRILDPERGVKRIEELDMSPENLSLVKEAMAKPYGLILITGPTGSGKSTSLYSFLRELDSEKNNIVSLEDPVEFQIAGVSQSQVTPEIGYTFASGLRSILRQDPDILMVGEIRDKETAQLAIQAALTGHLVFSTLHTNSAVGAIPRLIDMGIDPYLIAPTLILCIAQRLARGIFPASRHSIPMDKATRMMIDKQFEDLPDEYKSKLKLEGDIYDAVPSPKCPSGIRGRIAIYEMFKVDKEMQKLILEKPDEQSIYNLVRSKGMITIREDAIIKSLKGMIPFTEIYKF